MGFSISCLEERDSMFSNMIEYVLSFLELLLVPCGIFYISKDYTNQKFRWHYYIVCFIVIFAWYIIGIHLHNNISGLGFWVSIVEGLGMFLTPLILYLYFKKYILASPVLLLFLSLIIYQTFETFEDFLSVLFTSSLGDDVFQKYPLVMMPIVYSLLFGFLFHINKIWKFEFQYFVEKETEYKKVLNISILTMVIIQLVFSVSYVLGETEQFDSFGSILTTVCFLAFFLIMFYLRAKREDYEKEVELERQKRDQDNLQEYADKIVSLYNEVRSFRHDFAGMVSSLKISIDSGNLEEIKQIHREVLETANSHLGAEKFTIFELNNVGDSAFRSVLMDKAIKAEKYGIHLTLDIKDYIGKLPVKRLDLVRMTNIIFDNAIEGAYESHSKEVVLSVIELADSYVIVAKNSRKRQDLKLEKIYEMEYSTKGKHRGLGLPTVKRIVDSYDNITLDTEISRDFFTQVFHIDKERMF